MSTNKLTDVKCRRSKPGTQLWDGGGLFLHVSDTGRATWRQKYRYGGKQRMIVHGTYPSVTLTEARDLREKAKKLIDAGIDPVQRRREAKQQTVVRGVNTFERYATEHYEAIKHTHKNEKHSKQWIGCLKPLFDKVGGRPLADVTTADLVAVIAPIIKRTPESGRRLRQRVRQVFAAALEDGLVDRDPAISLHTNKRLQIPPRGEQQHFTALPWAEVPAFAQALRDYPAERVSAAARGALQFAILTVARTNEVLGARWDEIDDKAKTWTIPGERMKMGRTHIVPLSAQALAVLDEVKPLSGGKGWVFPSPRDPREPLSNMALLMVIRRLGYKGRATTHGFRSAFSSWAYERTHYREDVIEMALAHISGNKVKAAYLRSDFMADRVALMTQWTAHVTGETAKVLAFPQRDTAA